MKQSKKIIIIGGSAAGPKTAARARRLDENAELTIIQKSKYLSMASCGYPYYVGGVFDDRNQLISTPAGAVRDPNFFNNAKAIKVYNETEAIDIDRKNKKVKCLNLKDNTEFELPYDTLVLTTGATPRMPDLPGKELGGITTLQSMEDADFLRKIRDEKKIKKAVVIGGGLIGIETCEALQLAGIQITVIEQESQILMFLDPELAKIMENHIKTKAANVITNNAVSEFLGENGKLTAVKLKNGTELPCELAVVAIGVIPNKTLAEKAGLKIGNTKAIEVNEFMQTSDENIYAAGDCIEIPNLLTGIKNNAPYGDLANLEGRVAGENAIRGNIKKFPGTIHTGICKVFDYSAGSTGMSEYKAKKTGFDVTSVIIAGPDKPGFMKGKILISKITADNKTGRLLGFQCVGAGDVSKQIAQAAIAIMGKLTIAELVNSDLPYAPPFTLAIDNFIAACHTLENKMNGLFKGISSFEVMEKVNKKENTYYLDVRSPQEFEEMRLGIGEMLIPLGALRKRLSELPADKNAEIIVYCKISLRGYEAARIIQANGWNNVKVMEGGITTWPFHREK
ncbi:FAD-dependent oxidoreductase [Candidatus Dependentiae bacterium]|nr:FAD-dependent oxidoreductase [Candidatus Dependentiae bacterium]